jgi:hypothetical protein
LIYAYYQFDVLSRSYYSCDIIKFLEEDTNLILGKLTKNHPFALEEQQRNAWLKEIDILKNELKNLTSAYILFEYFIPIIRYFCESLGLRSIANRLKYLG